MSSASWSPRAPASRPTRTANRRCRSPRREGHTAAVDALLAAGADVNVRDSDGITPLMAAASSNRAGYPRAAEEGRRRERDQQRWRDGADRGGLRRTRAGDRRAARRRCQYRGARQGRALGAHGLRARWQRRGHDSADQSQGRPAARRQQRHERAGLRGVNRAGCNRDGATRRRASRRESTWRWRSPCADAACRWPHRCSTPAPARRPI